MQWCRLGGDDARDQEVAGIFEGAWSGDRGTVAAVSGQPLRRRAVMYLGPSRRLSKGHLGVTDLPQIWDQSCRLPGPATWRNAGVANKVFGDPDARRLEAMGSAGCSTLPSTLFLWLYASSRQTGPIESSSPLAGLPTPGAVACGSLVQIDNSHAAGRWAAVAEATRSRSEKWEVVVVELRLPSGGRGEFELSLRKTGAGSTGGDEAAAEMLAKHKWAESTWKRQFSQILRWCCFCEEQQRDALPAEEGDVLAYVGFLCRKAGESAVCKTVCLCRLSVLPRSWLPFANADSHCHSVTRRV